MTTSGPSGLASSVDFDEEHLWVELTDGRKLGVPLVYFPRLLKASAEQRADCTISGGGTGLHWDQLGEDISVEGLLRGIGDRTRPSAEAA